MLLLAEPETTLVRARWARAERLGLSREADGYPSGTTDADLAVRRDRLEQILRGETATIAPISAELAGGALVAIVADRDGVILSARADRRALDPATRVRLVEGARWDEETRGTNAIGTAIAEGSAVAVIGAAHYERRNRDLFCFATPIRDAYGDIVAVLDVTGPMLRFDATVGTAVQSAGVALEHALRALAWADQRAGALAALERALHRSRDAAMLIDASGALRVANMAARAALPLGKASPVCERIFGVGFQGLLALASRPSGMRFETASGVYAVSIDPVAGADGRAIAAVVQLERERSRVMKNCVATKPFDSILSDDARTDDAKRRAERFAATSLPVLLLAETGTGKELFARAIHRASDRQSGPFVSVSCGALSPDLIASELFGYAPHAFTGASRGGSDGRIAAAHGGTLFLDEIAETPDALQAALLRVLEDGSYSRVGETRERRSDFRLVCATCRDLPAMVARGTFRSDLFYRIHGASVTIPPLRERTDAQWLAGGLLDMIAPEARPTLSGDALQYVHDHDWPGNVRELKAALGHALALADDDGIVRREHFPEILVSALPRLAHRPADATTRSEIFATAVDEAMRAAGGNVSEAARRLGVSRGTLYRALKRG